MNTSPLASLLRPQTLDEVFGQQHLLRRGQMEAYFPAFLDTAALRLYKDGGVAAVIRQFNEAVLPLLPLDAMKEEKLSPGARLGTRRPSSTFTPYQ